MFDANDFLSSQNEQVLDDKFIPIPEGEYTAQIGMEDRDMEIKPGEKDGKPWARCVVRFEILDPSGELEKKLFRKPFISYDFFLDLTEDGKFDHNKQKNIRMGALLAAANKNRPGWRPTDIRGVPMKIKVAHVKGMNGEKRPEVVMVGVA